jgi:hypothetical protein
MNSERLEHLITIMEKVAEKQRPFNMTAWALPKHDFCNTPCCALGWAAFDPQCVSEGLHMQATWDVSVDERCSVSINIDERCSVLSINIEGWWADIARVIDEHVVDFAPVYQDQEGFDAAMAYYDISEETANFLFDPSGYSALARKISPQDVIQNIRKVLIGYEPEPWDDEEPPENLENDEPNRPVGFV